MRKRVRSRAAVLWCVAIVLLAALPAFLLPAGAGWITDNGNKYIKNSHFFPPLFSNTL